MNYTCKNIVPIRISKLSIGLQSRNFFFSVIYFFLVSFFSLNGYAQHISNGRSLYESTRSKTIIAGKDKSVVSKTALAITSTGTGGLWSAGATWVGGVPPTVSDDVTIAPGATVIVDVSTAVCRDITIEGTLIFNAGINL